MKVKYAERGTFDGEKAARGLIELANKIKKKNILKEREKERKNG